MRVGIIGGGAAGLAAAYELLRQGHEAAVFERAPFLGGQASTFDVGGVPLERGYHHLFTSDVDMLWLIRELGLEGKLAWMESKVGLYHGGRVWPFTTPLDLMKFGDLPVLDRLRLGLSTLYLQRTRRWRQFEGHTAAEWLRSRAGRRAYEAVWEPMLRGKFGRYYDQVGMAWLWGKIALRVASRGKAMARERLGYPLGSFGEIFDTLGERIRSMGGQVHIRAAVSGVATREGRVSGLDVELPDQEAQIRPFDAVIATVPSSILARLVSGLPSDYLSKLEGITYLAAVLLVLVLDRPLTWAYWLNVADRSIPFLGVVEQTNFLPPEHYGGRHVVYLANYLARDDPLFSLDHQELLGTYLPHLRRLNPAFEESWIQESYYHRENAAQPVIDAGYGGRIPSHRTPISGLYLANTTQIYPEDRGTNYSVRLGRKVARLVLGDNGHRVQGELPRPAIPDGVTSVLQ